MCKESAFNPFKLRKAILMGCRRQLVVDGRLFVGVAGIQRPEEEMTYERLHKVFQRKGIFDEVEAEGKIGKDLLAMKTAWTTGAVSHDSVT